MDERTRSTLTLGLPAAAAATVLGVAAARRARDVLSDLHSAHAADTSSLALISWSRTPAAALEEAVAIVVLGAGLATAAWYLLSVLTVLACGSAAALGARWHQGEAALERWGAPALRHAAAVVVGLVMTASATAAGAAPAIPSLPDDLRWATSGTATGPELGRLSGERPPPTVDAAGEAGPTTTTEQVILGKEESSFVRPGDSLWVIASRALEQRGETPTTAAVATEWPRWYAANRDLIGPDPDLIHPGQALRPPNEGDSP